MDETVMVVAYTRRTLGGDPVFDAWDPETMDEFQIVLPDSDERVATIIEALDANADESVPVVGGWEPI